MIEFPKNTVVSISSSLPTKGESRIVLRIQANDLDNGVLFSDLGARIVFGHINLDEVKSLDQLEKFTGKRILFDINRQNAPLIAENVQFFHRINSMFSIKIDSWTKKILNLLAEYRFPVRLRFDENTVPENDLLDSLDLFLHSNAQQTAVEPFFSLLSRVCGRSAPDLWQSANENADRHFYVGDDGKIALSLRHYRTGRILGTTADTYESICSSETYTTNIHIKERMPIECRECAFCPHFDLCAGYFKALDYNYDCSVWRAIFSGLKECAAEASGRIAADG